MEPKLQHKKVSRRSFLKISGAAFVLLAGGGIYRAFDKGVFATATGTAYEPWNLGSEIEAGVSDKGPLRLVRYAILAANAHNTQPWLFRIRPERVELYSDIARNIGAIDPVYREMYISLGCAIESLCIAAQAHGYAPQVKLLEGGFDHIKVADILLTSSDRDMPDLAPLFPMITKRHTHRGAYDTAKSVPEKLLQEMAALGQELSSVKLLWHADKQAKDHVGSLIIQATQAIIRDAEQSRDSHRWYRHDRAEIQRFKDGTTLDATGNPAIIRAIGKLLPVSEQSSNKHWLRMTQETQVPTAAAFGSIVIQSRSRTHLMEAGRLWQRIHLWATSKGLVVQPLNQVNERQDRERQLGLEPLFGNALRRLAGDGEHIFMFRCGYPQDQALPSPRRSADEVLLQS